MIRSTSSKIMRTMIAQQEMRTMSVRNEAELIAARARRSIDDDSWSPDDTASRTLADLETLLAVRIQAGQASLQEMNDAMIASVVQRLRSIAPAGVPEASVTHLREAA